MKEIWHKVHSAAVIKESNSLTSLKLSLHKSWLEVLAKNLMKTQL